MPCRCDYMDDTTEEAQRKEIDKLTQNLCFMCGTITEKKLWEKFPNQRIKDWWEQHKADDTKRVTEAIRAYVVKHPRTMATNIANRFIRDAESKHPVSEYHKKWFYDIAKKEVDAYRAKKASKNGLKASIKNKLTPDEIKFLKTHKV